MPRFRALVDHDRLRPYGGQFQRIGQPDLVIAPPDRRSRLRPDFLYEAGADQFASDLLRPCDFQVRRLLVCAPVALREPLRRRTLPSWVDWMEATSGGAETHPLRPAFGERSDFAVRNPKNRWPFQFVPVIALAICERLP